MHCFVVIKSFNFCFILCFFFFLPAEKSGPNTIGGGETEHPREEGSGREAEASGPEGGVLEEAGAGGAMERGDEVG